ncbi:MAG: molybdenum cofactor biosynthesis protein B [Butyricicoccus sp.]
MSGPAVKNLLERAGYAVGAVEVLPDEQPRIESALIHAADEEKLALIVTTGGTSLAPRDNAGGDHQGLRKARQGIP